MALGSRRDFLGAQSVERSLALLLLVARCRSAGASLGDIAEETSLKLPTARRILLALIRSGLVEQDETSRRYFLGPESYVLGTVAAERFGIDRIASDSLQRLVELSHDNVFISVRNGFHTVCLHRYEGTYPVRAHVLAAGDRHPLGIGAGSLAILAALPDAEIDFIIRTNSQICAKRYPLATDDAIRRLVADARRNGYALNPGLIFPGAWGIGAAIHDPPGTPVAALSIAAIESRMTEEHQAKLAAGLIAETRVIEAQLHDIRSRGSGSARTPRRRKRARSKLAVRSGNNETEARFK
jgi:DNA-binding IclR family transcriptional regulator